MNENPAFLPRFVDTHAHLTLDPLGRDPAAVVERARFAGVEWILTVGIDPLDAAEAVKTAEALPRTFAALGIHPHNAAQAGEEGLETVRRLARRPKVKALGEIGLDFFRDWSPRDLQIASFSAQLEIARELKLPFIIHLRDAYEKGLEMLEAAAPHARGGVIHCFSGNLRDAERAVEMGLYLSFPGTLTYKKNEELREVLRRLPLNRFLLETDCPFLAPEPLRGKNNEPAYLVHTARKAAEVLGLSLEEVARITTDNAFRLFGLSAGESALEPNP